MGGLALDTRAGLHSVVVAGKLLKAVRYTDAQLKMPPTGKLPDAAIADFEKWIAMGAPDPRQDTAPTTARQGIDFEKGKKWWAFQPLKQLDPPTVANSQWPRRKIDYFILAKLDENEELQPSPACRQAHADSPRLFRSDRLAAFLRRCGSLCSQSLRPTLTSS